MLESAMNPTFSKAEAAALAGIPAGTLGVWVFRGVIPRSSRFTPEDVGCLRILRALTEAGVPLRTAARAARAAAPLLAESPGGAPILVVTPENWRAVEPAELGGLVAGSRHPAVCVAMHAIFDPWSLRAQEASRG